VPAVVFVMLASAGVPLWMAARAVRGTALRSAVIWAVLAIGLGLISQAVALGEPLNTGRPAAGHWTYVCMLAALAALISVFNARRPGEAAWAILMALLVVVFLIPWLEGVGLARPVRGQGSLRLDSPWTLFYGVLVVAGVTNYLPTRYGPAAGWLALGFGVEYLGLTRPGVPFIPQGLAWSVFPATLALAVWTAAACSERKPRTCTQWEAWIWFRDHWGVVWALRVQERFNRSAAAQGWPIRLGWHGVESAADPNGDPGEWPPTIPAEAEATFRSLLRRFADPARLESAFGPPAPDPCQPPDLG
jgi:hypothetical protein